MNLNNNGTEAGGSTQTQIALIVEYEGTEYHGFQWQPGASTIQGELEKALERLTGQKVRVEGASRTDAGVHAQGQVVSFRTSTEMPPETYITALNYYLPLDIAVRQACKVSESFSARRYACSRQYRYSILNRRTPSPLHRKFSYQVGGALDVEDMDSASKLLIGTHDLAAFSDTKTATNSTVRQVFGAEVTGEGHLVILKIEANAFLPQQVRRTAGALVEVGLGKSSIEGFRQLLDRKKPGVGGPTLPAKGLCLVKVNYPSRIWGIKSVNEEI